MQRGRFSFAPPWVRFLTYTSIGVSGLGRVQFAQHAAIQQLRTSEYRAELMGYFFMTAIGALWWLGYLPVPKAVMIWGCVGYVLYDAVKR